MNVSESISICSIFRGIIENNVWPVLHYIFIVFFIAELKNMSYIFVCAFAIHMKAICRCRIKNLKHSMQMTIH